MTVFARVQQVATVLGGPVTAAFIIHSAVCGSNDHVFLAKLISISMFISGLCTIIQVTIGVRSHHVHYTFYCCDFCGKFFSASYTEEKT